MNSSKQIKYGAIISYASISLNIIAGLLYTPWMIRQIGKSDYGIFILATSFLTYFVMDFGLGDTAARYIARYRAEKKEHKISDLLGLTMRIYLLIDLALLVILCVLFFYIQNVFVKLSAEELTKFRVVFCIIGLFSILSFPTLSVNGILIAYERFVLLKLCDLLNKIFTIILMVIVLLVGFKLYGLVLINTIVGTGLIILKIIYLSKTTDIQINYQYRSNNLLRELFKYSIWVTIIGIAQRLIMNATPTVLGILSGTSQIAIFAIGMTIEGYIWTFANALNGLFLPKVSQMAIKKERRSEITSLMIRVGRIQLFIYGFMIVAFISLGKEFIIFWLGEDFSYSYSVAILLIMPGIISLTQEIGNTLLIVENELKYRAMLFIGASAISLSLSICLAPKYGAIGSAIGIFVSLILCHIVGMNIVFSKVLRLDIYYFFRECHFKMLIPLIITVLFGYLIHKYIPAHNMITFIPKALIFIVVYFCIMWSIALNKNEKYMLRSMVGRLSIA